MQEYMIDRNIGYNFKINKNTIKTLRLNKLKMLYKICILCNNYGDITLINPVELEDFDLFNFSFPCTNVSIAGKKQGFEDEEGNITSSGLYKYGIEILKVKQPKYVMIENVKNLVGKKFKKEFDKILNQLDEIGYNVYWKVLNAKDYGIPQNRERVFTHCIRKDIDKKDFEFPIAFDNGLRLKDILEDKIDNKYYLNQEVVEKFLKNNDINNPSINDNFSIVGTLKGCMKSFDNSFVTIAQVYGLDSISPTLDTMQGGYRQPKVLIKEDNKYKIRRLTPKECWRLMGFEDRDIDKCIEFGTSDTQLYKQAGNSIVVKCLEKQFKVLFKDCLVK